MTNVSLTAPTTSVTLLVTFTNTFTELLGRIPVVHPPLSSISSAKKYLELSKHFAALLVHRPGSIAFGCHAGTLKKGRPDEAYPIFRRSRESGRADFREGPGKGRHGRG